MTLDVRDGWHGPEDRKLMVRAVAKFSDECEAPELTPECPYYEVDKKGAPACAEQCQDLIARYPGDLATGPAMGLDIGLVALRRRPRRGPAPDEMLYDTGQIRMEDEERPLEEWRLGSLLEVAKTQSFSVEPVTDKCTVRELVEQLRRHGVRVDTDLALGLGPEVQSSIGAAVMMRSMGDNPRALELAAGLTSHLDAWAEALDAVDGLSSEHGLDLVNPLGRQAILGWLTTLTPVEVLSDVAPTPEDLRFGLEVYVDDAAAADARWMIDRFTVTYLHEWSPTSRSREWQYVHAQRPGCCSPGIMRSRAVNAPDLARLIADEHCDQEQQATPAGKSWTATHFKNQAIANLKKGMFSSAANVFRVHVELDPENAEAHNDLGFCLLPVDPKEASDHLIRSLDIGARIPTMTQFNLALALHLIGEGDDAYRIALDALRDGISPTDPGYMWIPGDDGLEFTRVENLLDYGEYLVHHIVDCTGNCVPAPVMA